MSASDAILSNAEIADHLTSLAQLLSFKKENPHRVKAYFRAAAKIRIMSESFDELVHNGDDLTQFVGIGPAIAAAIREIVLTGTLAQLDRLRSEARPELLEMSRYPRLDPRKILRIYKRLNIHSIESLRQKLTEGEIDQVMGGRIAQHVLHGLEDPHAMLLSKAGELCKSIEDFLIERCNVRRVESVGGFRRRVEVLDDLSFLVETEDFPAVVSRLQRYGGRTPLRSSAQNYAQFALASGITLSIHAASEQEWGAAMIETTGSDEHLQKLSAVVGWPTAFHFRGTAQTEEGVYEQAGLDFIEPELREGRDEVERARKHDLPRLIQETDLRGELHAHSLSSDGTASIEKMMEAGRRHGYEYLGITDHSQSLKIARGVSVDDLWKQIRYIDTLNEKLDGFRLLKSAEVDILADGSLDYPDELLKELDYTVCSIHSRFGLGKTAQTERILRAMENRHFNILGHPTGRLLLKRPGYEIDIDRIIVAASQNQCFLEINSSPDRLDLPSESARHAALAGVKLAISTDAHGTREFANSSYGIDQARRAGIEKKSVLNSLHWEELRQMFRR